MNRYKVYIRIKGLLDTIYVDADSLDQVVLKASARFEDSAVVKAVLI